MAAKGVRTGILGNHCGIVEVDHTAHWQARSRLDVLGRASESGVRMPFEEPDGATYIDASKSCCNLQIGWHHNHSPGKLICNTPLLMIKCHEAVVNLRAIRRLTTMTR